MVPDTRYAVSPDGVHLAYQVLGSGDLDVLLVPSGWGHLELRWDWPSYAKMLRRLGSFSRLMMYDKRGQGLSDRESELPTLEQQAEDLMVVMDACGSERAALLGVTDGAAIAAYCAAAHPERVSALVMYAGAPYASPEFLTIDWDGLLASFPDGWGSADSLAQFAPNHAEDGDLRRFWSRFQRSSMGPAAAQAWISLWRQFDARTVLPAVRVPTLSLHRHDDRVIRTEAARAAFGQIPDVRIVDLPGEDNLMWLGDTDAIIDEIEEFLTGVRPQRPVDRVLATVMFIDVVGSTEELARRGDRDWRDVLDRFRALVRRELVQHRGREINTRGDDFLATFDGPARAVRCAARTAAAASSIGLEIRAGLHTGEIEVTDDDDITGLAVHIGARIASLSEPGEVLVSGTVKDLVLGAGLTFAPRGTYVLKGVPGDWQLFTLTGAG